VVGRQLPIVTIELYY